MCLFAVKKFKSLNSFLTLAICKRCIHGTSATSSYYRKGPREGYTKVEENLKKLKKIDVIRHGFQELKNELKVWKEEIQEKFRNDPILFRRPGEIYLAFSFETKEKRDRWVVTSDSDHNEGYSTSSFVTTDLGTGLFSGNISTKVPVDGRVKKAGYCNVTSIRNTKSFKRFSPYDWSDFTHLVLKVRGDGRSYMLNLHCPGQYDLLWNDTFHFVLYTRGGPYWQLTKIPFSKFFLAARGRVQDAQVPMPKTLVSSVGITASDGIDGPFSLEIDYIGLEFIPDHAEEFAYEMYRVERFIAKS